MPLMLHPPRFTRSAALLFGLVVGLALSACTSSTVTGPQAHAVTPSHDDVAPPPPSDSTALGGYSVPHG